jgi:beta-glucosidase
MGEFPNEFVWGVSTAAYQIEGAWDAGGKGPSIWDTFAHTPGKIARGDTGDVACDHVHRYLEDCDLMAELGIGAYRFSVSWPRWMPEGRGRVAPAGRDFYERLVDALLERSITPWLCLYHWDLPQVLQDAGGWAKRDTALHFADYAGSVAERLGDRVPFMAMMNEPNVAGVVGHVLGMHAPGITDFPTFVATSHHLNLATGLALERVRADRPGVAAGNIVNVRPVESAEDRDEDHRAAALLDAVLNLHHVLPLLGRGYPAATAPLVDPFVRDGDLATIAAGLDWFGLNHYTKQRVRADPASVVGLSLVDPPPDAERTAMGWEVAPDALFERLTFLGELLGDVPLYVTENGAAFDDPAPQGEGIDDRARIDYLSRYVRAVARAREAGVDVRGYFVWTLLDNFEWHEGYAKRFGLVHVDHGGDLRRTPKASFRWFQELVATGSPDRADAALER